MNYIELVFSNFKIAIDIVKIAFKGFVDFVVKYWSWLLEKLSNTPLIPKSWKTNLHNASVNLKEFGEGIDKSIGSNLKDLKKNVDNSGKALTNLFTGKEGAYASWFNNLADKLKKGTISIKDFFAQLNKLDFKAGKSTNAPDTKSFWQGFSEGLDAVAKELKDFGKLGAKVATDLATAMQTTLGNFFNDAFTGQLKKAQDYFADFGRALLQSFSQVISQMITKWIIFGNMVSAGGTGQGWLGIVGKIAGLFGGAGGGAGGGVSNIAGSSYNTAGLSLGTMQYHQGGLIRAHSGLAIDEVPIIAQKGERVLSRKQNKEYEAGMTKGDTYQPIVIIQAWDTQDIMRNRKSIEGIISNALRNNSAIRGDIKRYG
jgi:hypothetical protein